MVMPTKQRCSKCRQEFFGSDAIELEPLCPVCSLPDDILKTIGKSVVMTSGHPWSGQAGEIIRYENTPFGMRPRVRLHNGVECLATRPGMMRFSD